MEKIKTIRNKIYNSILETIGNTPLIKVPRISKKYNCFGYLPYSFTRKYKINT